MQSSPLAFTCRRIAFPRPSHAFYPQTRRWVSSAPVFDEVLPPVSTWRKLFPTIGEASKRFAICNPDTAKIVAEALVPEGSRDKIIIEACPGPGQLTRALLDLPKERIARIILLENYEPYFNALKPLTNDPRVRVFPLHGQYWDTYRKLEEAGAMEGIQTHPWNGAVHPQLQFVMQLSMAVLGEQLIAQLMRAIPDEQWLFKYGRVPMNFLLTQRMWDRLKAPPDHMNRCKVSVMAQATAECTELVPPTTLYPYADHFYPIKHKLEQRNTYLDTRRLGNPIAGISVVPHEKQVIASGDLDYWDYCVRKLFVQKATPLKKCIGALGPGAGILIPKLTDPRIPTIERINPDMTPRSFGAHEWGLVVKAFKGWPFRPDALTIDTFFEPHHTNR